MAVKPSDVGFGEYGGFSGPFFRGVIPYKLPDNPTYNDKLLAVITAAEGGTYDAINGYDSGCFSLGIIQWIESNQFSVSDIVGCVAEACGLDYVLQKLEPALKLSNATFRKNDKGKWRYVFNQGNIEVNTNQLLQRLYHNGPNTKGSWTPDRVLHSKTWAACVANLFEDPRAQKAQIDYTVPRLMGFVYGAGKEVLFKGDNSSEDGYVGLIKALYVSFAINSPANAAKAIGNGAAKSKNKKWSRKWCLDLMHALVFYGIGIWPARYDAKRPVLEKLFDIKLPKNSAELRQRKWDSEPDDLVTSESPKITSVVNKVNPPTTPENPSKGPIGSTHDAPAGESQVSQEQQASESLSGQISLTSPSTMSWLTAILAFLWQFIMNIVKVIKN